MSVAVTTLPAKRSLERPYSLPADLADMPRRFSPLSINPRPPSEPPGSAEARGGRRSRSHKKRKDKQRENSRPLRKQRSKSCVVNMLQNHSQDRTNAHFKTRNPDAISTHFKSRSQDFKLPSLAGERTCKTPQPPRSSPIRVDSAPRISDSNIPTQKSNARNGTEGKKAKKVSLLTSITPLNLESEKEKFMKARYEYNPHFFYRNPPSESALERQSHASEQLLPQAIKIMTTALQRHGSFERYAQRTGGRKLTRVEILDITKRFLRKECLDREIMVQLSDNMVPRACMTRVKGQPTLQVRSGDIREFWVHGMLRHEIGTHYIRSWNHKLQPWHHWRTRKELHLRPLNPTEEGLASLHSVIFREDPCLWRSALLYYTIWRASSMSFTELFKDLGLYVRDPEVRWEYCVRAKRGMIDTSNPGAFCKDQVYLTGGLSILKRRSELDFHLLVRAGKVCFRDLDRIQDMVTVEGTRIPGFMEDLNIYRQALDHIASHNGLTNEDLLNVS